MKKKTAGFLVLAVDGRTLFSAGVAEQEEVAEAILGAWRKHVPLDRGLFSVGDDPGFSIVSVSSDEATLFAVFEREANDVLFDFASTVSCADDILRHLLTNPYQAITVVDKDGFISYLSPVHERFFGLARGEAVGKFVTDVIENTRLHDVARTGKAEIGQLQQMRATTRVVTRMPILDSAGNIVAAIGQVMFKGPDQLATLSAEVARLKSEVTYYQQALAGDFGRRHGLDRIIGQSKAIQRLKEQICKIAPLNVQVLLVGESGTGKELVSHAIHLLSTRRDESMVMVNAAAMPSTLVESELFGYEAGAFTGAERKGRRGKFEQAHQGTLFLDEVGDMPLEIQVKLLRVLQDGSFERVGSDKPRISNFRLVSATNRDFPTMIDKGEFRLDLFYRLSVVTLYLPPLRERLEDIPLLANQALYDFAIKNSTKQKSLAHDVVPFLQQQSWPGNVRQLMHAVESAAIFSDSDVITVDEFRGQRHVLESIETVPSARPLAGPAPESSGKPSVKEAVNLVEDQLIRAALKQFAGNKKRIALELGISRSYLYKKLASMGH
jgi:PAS domain S-box-containing protein